MKRRIKDPIRDCDQLTAELRASLASAVLTWRPSSARRAFDRAVARTRDTSRTLNELDMLQERLVARDALTVWGQEHAHASTILKP